MNFDPIKRKYNNSTREKRKALYDLRNDTSIIIKGTDKDSVVVIWDKEDYSKQPEEHLSCKVMCEGVTDDPSYLTGAMPRTLEKVRKRDDIGINPIMYFDVDDPKFDRFCPLPKIHKRLHSVSGRPVISSSSFCTENVSRFSHTSRTLTIFSENFKTSLNFQMT